MPGYRSTSRGDNRWAARGPGYRVYFMRRGPFVVALLYGEEVPRCLEWVKDRMVAVDGVLTGG